GPTTSVAIFSDSSSSLQAIQDRASKTPLVIAIQRLLIRHGDRRSALTIHWVKAHVGTSGNERADELAKDCLADDAILVQVDAPMSFVKRCLSEAAYANWNTKWITAQHGRWTSFFFPSIGHRKRAGKLPL